jgi:hypothetical protein
MSDDFVERTKEDVQNVWDNYQRKRGDLMEVFYLAGLGN